MKRGRTDTADCSLKNRMARRDLSKRVWNAEQETGKVGKVQAHPNVWVEERSLCSIRESFREKTVVMSGGGKGRECFLLPSSAHQLPPLCSSRA